MENNAIQEYNRLVDEIGRYQEQIFTTFICAVTTTGSLFALAFTEFILPESRWVILFVPWVIVFPCVLLQIQRVKATWLIGMYLKHSLEPKLDLKWTSFITTYYEKSKHAKSSERFFSYGLTSSLALIVIQALCPLLALFQKPNLYQWLIMTIIVAASIIMQSIKMYKSRKPVLVEEEVKKILKVE